MLLFMHMDKNRLMREGEYVTYEKPAFGYFIAAALLGVFAAITVNNLLDISGLTTQESETYDEIAETIYSGSIYINLIVYAVLGPVVEELVFRGLLYKRLRESMGVVISVVFSALMFGVYHGNLAQGIYAGILGVVFALCMEKFKSVLAPILAHVLANVFSILFSSLGGADFLNQSTTYIIIYIAGGAILTLVFLYIVCEKVNAKVLIPAAGKPIETEE